MKKDRKNNHPLTAFGEILKNAIAKPIAERESENKNQSPAKPVEKSQKTLPAKLESSSAKPPNLTYKIGAAAPAEPLTKKPAAQTSPQKPISSQKNIARTPPPSAKNSSAVADKSEIPAIGEIKKMPLQTSQPIESKAKNVSENSQKYSNLMRKKFWENLDGEIQSSNRGRTVRVNLGIDLGTSFSKVVYRLGGESFPVRFGTNKNKIEDYLMPSVVVVGSKGIKCRFEFEDEEKLKKAAQIPNFKICLTCERNTVSEKCSITKCNLSNLKTGYLPTEVTNEEASFLTAFYLAKLIARTKETVRQRLPEREIPSNVTVKWSANLAVPDKFIDSNVAEGFRESLEIAWLMSEMFVAQPNFSIKQEAALCYLTAKELHTEIKIELRAQGKDFDCFTYSEIGAEVASVTLSPTSEEGLYVLVDVGAGTVDTSVFRFRRVDGESVQETYAANVFKLGAAQIDARANASFTRKSLNWFRQIKENIFRQNAGDALIHITEEIKSAEQSVIAELREKLISVYREAFEKQRNIETWEHLKLVMGGGGSAITAYSESAREAFSPKIKEARLIEISSLKVPRDFQMDTLPISQFHRFAVAYGLSRERIELPELVAADKIAPIGSLRQKIYVDPTNDG